MSLKPYITKTWAVIRRILWYKSIVLGIVLVLLFLFILALQSVYVQTYLAQIASKEISKTLKFPISIKFLKIDWFDQIQLKQVRVKDRKDNSMIYVENLTLNYRLFDLMKDGNIYVEDAILDSANINLIDYPDSLGGMNIDEFILAIDNSPADTTKKISAGSRFNIKQIELRRSYFSFNKPLAARIDHSGFDQNHFAFDNLNGDVKNFVLVRDTVELDIKNLRGIEPRIKFPIKEITTLFRYHRKGIEFHGLTAHLGNSILSDTILFRFNRPDRKSVV